MAKQRQYVYQIKGTKLSLVEVDYTSAGDGLNYEYTGSDLEGGGTGGDPINLSSAGSLLKSPLATVADGLEIEYVYSPEYRINNEIKMYASIDRYDEDGNGFLVLVNSGGVIDFASALTPAVAVGGYVLMKNAGKWNGIHKVSALATARITTTTPYKGTSTGAQVSFEETTKMYYDVNVLDNEDDIIDLPNYLSQALVYYVKAKVAEDLMELELKEYCMREFRRMIEKHENAKVTGPRRIMTGLGAVI